MDDNSTDPIPGNESPAEHSDHRVAWIVIGAILLAFSIGIVLFMVAVVTDWKH